MGLSNPLFTSSILAPELAYTAPDYSTTTLRAFAEEKALQYGIDQKKFVSTIGCESGFKFDAVGDKGTSIGIAQFRYPGHWGISTSTALDPYAALDLAAASFKVGLASRWTCYINLSK